MRIEDVTAVKPAGWGDHAASEIQDPDSRKPEDWDDEEVSLNFIRRIYEEEILLQNFAFLPLCHYLSLALSLLPPLFLTLPLFLSSPIPLPPVIFSLLHSLTPSIPPSY